MNDVAALPQTRQDVYHARISRVVDEAMATEEVLRERLHRQKIIQHITKLMQCNFSPAAFLAIKDEDFRLYVGQLMVKQLLA